MRQWVAVLIVVSGCQNQAENVSANREHAEKWVADMLPGYTLAGFSSATLDSDGDGYVTVDITVQKADVLRLIQLDCPTAGEMMPTTGQRGQACKFKQTPLDNHY